MTDHKTGTREEWLAARLELLEAEKELTRRSDELARRRQELPWVRIDKEYRFETDEGTASLADLFRGRSQLLVYHFMFGPDYTAGCPSCSAIADGFDGSVVHLANHDVTLCAVSRAPLAKLQAYKRRMGWSFPWASSFGSDFNYDFQVGAHEGAAAVGSRRVQLPRDWTSGRRRPARRSPVLAEFASSVRHGLGDVHGEKAPGVSAFALDDGVVYHTYSAYARGLDGLWGMYQWLDRAPLGRNETRLLVAPPRRVRQRVRRRSPGTSGRRRWSGADGRPDPCRRPGGRPAWRPSGLVTSWSCRPGRDWLTLEGEPLPTSYGETPPGASSAQARRRRRTVGPVHVLIGEVGRWGGRPAVDRGDGRSTSSTAPRCRRRRHGGRADARRPRRRGSRRFLRSGRRSRASATPFARAVWPPRGSSRPRRVGGARGRHPDAALVEDPAGGKDSTFSAAARTRHRSGRSCGRGPAHHRASGAIDWA